MKNRFALIGLLLGFVSSSCLAQNIRIQGGLVVDPALQTIERRDLVVCNGVIVDSMKAPCIPETVIDASGQWIIPGLVDMHVHAWGNQSATFDVNAAQVLGFQGTAEMMARAGVTSMLDLFSNEREIFDARDRQRRGEFGGATIFAAGPCLTAPKGHCTEYGTPTRVIDSPESARAVIADLALSHPDVIKIVYDHAFTKAPTIDKPTLEAALEAASKVGIKTVVHIGTWDDVRDTINGGASAVTHLPTGLVPGDIPDLAVRRGVLFIPTLTVQLDFSAILSHPEMLDDPFLISFTTPALLESYRHVDQNTPLMSFFLSWQAAHGQTDYANIKTLADRGVKMAAGTDMGNVGTFVGYSLHREIAHFVAAGMSSWQALAAATVEPARFLGARWGVQPGCVANLVLLGGSPIADITNTRRINDVIQAGRIVQRLNGGTR